MSDAEGLERLFFEVHRDLPREAPGSAASTRRALEIARGPLPARPRVVDVACGPGAQTRVLAEVLEGAQITAFDLHAPFLDQLRRSLKGHPAEHRVEVMQADMATWSPPAPVDLVWCEGAAYIMGVEGALRRWQAWLRPGGVVAFTDAVWRTRHPSPEAAAMWSEYPAMRDIEGCLAWAREAGYRGLGHFVLPASDWLDDYYTPLERRLEGLRRRYADDPEALAEIDVHQREVDVFRAHGEEYGYLFVVARAEPTGG